MLNKEAFIRIDCGSGQNHFTVEYKKRKKKNQLTVPNNSESVIV